MVSAKFSTLRGPWLCLFIGVSEATRDAVGVGGTTSFSYSLPFVGCVVGQFLKTVLTAGLAACSGAGIGDFLIYPKNFARGVARHSSSRVPDCELLLGFLLGEGNAKISSSSSGLCNSSFFILIRAAACSRATNRRRNQFLLRLWI